jgi:glutamate racemase
MSDLRPIGVFDSGIGGLTVVKALRDLLPNENIFTFGDTARVPTARKSRKPFSAMRGNWAGMLKGKNAKALVVACNYGLIMSRCRC